MKTKETFASLLKAFEYHYDLRSVFNDFLTMTLCAFSHNPITGLSHDEDIYMETIEKYKVDPLRHNFPKMVEALTCEMEYRHGSDAGSDVLGEFYEQNLYRKGASQYFTPWSLCHLLAQATGIHSHYEGRPLRILDPCCGSGRTLLASFELNGRDHRYYGIDIDETCVKMTAINLFLHGVFKSEVMWADALQPNDFRSAYRISFLPFGIFRIKEKERSTLWMLNQNSPFEQGKRKVVVESARKGTGGNMSQLNLF